MASLFSKQASVYAAARPRYPPELFKLLASLSQGHKRAWDVGTGNGQAAVGLAEHFEEVIATDISAEQLQLAEKRPNITYRATSAGALSDVEVAHVVGGEGSLDLITVAQAVHWFDLPSFYGHVRRLLRKPGGIFAVWCYTLPECRACGRLKREKQKRNGPFWRLRQRERERPRAKRERASRCSKNRRQGEARQGKQMPDIAVATKLCIVSSSVQQEQAARGSKAGEANARHGCGNEALYCGNEALYYGNEALYWQGMLGGKGKQIHARHGWGGEIAGFAQHGCGKEARDCFYQRGEIAGFAQHGCSKEARDCIC